MCFSNHRSDLQKRTACITNKARSLTEEILEVKRCLADAKACYIAGREEKSLLVFKYNTFITTR